MKNILSCCDAYKISHKFQYPPGTEYVYSNWTIRGSRLPGVDHYIFYGAQYFIKEYLIRRFNEEFFNLPKEEALASFKRRIKNYLGDVDLSHFDKLHDLGYLPIKIKAVPEGTKLPMRVPCLTIINTLPEFYWMTNYLETIMSTTIWGGINSATIANVFARTRDKYLDLTCDDASMRMFLNHDFSYRGMFGNEAAMISGSAFLLSSCGSDTISAVDFLEEYYDANSDREMVGVSVPATEHSVACAGGQDGEEETLLRLIRNVYPTGILSFVCDTWDYFHFINATVRNNREEIKKRDGKLVLRPDSSPKTPLEIICGDKTLEDKNSPEYKGSLELLWDIFGGSINSKGYKVLHPSIGLIYGEAISMDLYDRILSTMKDMGFAASNLVVGIGSYSFQYQTRDSLKQAIKATWVQMNGEGVEIFKDPKTDNTGKKSARGLLRVDKTMEGDYVMTDRCSWEQEDGGVMRVIFENGELKNQTTLTKVRESLRKEEKLSLKMV